MSGPWASPTRPSTPCPSPCTDLALMDCAFWKNLPAPATPVNAIQIHPDFHQNLCQRLERLRDQILARNELLSKDVLEYRFGHNPPGFYDHDKTQQFVKEYIQYLEPPTPPNPTTSASVSISSPKTLSISRSSPSHSSDDAFVSCTIEPVPAEIERHETTSPLGIDKKRKRYADKRDESYDQSKRQRGMHVGVELDMRNSAEDIAAPACLSQCSATLELSRDPGSCECQVGSPS
jgi:hypothetical protein